MLSKLSLPLPLLGLLLGACASSQPPANTPANVAAAPAAQPVAPVAPQAAQPAQAAPPPAATTAAPAPPQPAATTAPIAADGLPQLPTTPAPTSTESAAPTPPAAAAPAAPAPPAQPAIVSIVDEKPFAAPRVAATSTTAPTTSTRTRSHHPAQQAHARHRRGHDHPEPRIVVDVTASQGNVQSAEVQRAARAKGYGAIRHCYEEGLRRNQHLSGRTSFELVVGADGAVVDSPHRSSSLNDDSVVQCVVREISHLQLFSADNSNATVAFAVTLTPGDDPVSVPHAVPHADKLREALRAKWSGVEVCYKQGLDKVPDLGGRVELKFKVKPSGEIVEVQEGDAHFADADVARCVAGVFKSGKLAKTGARKETSFVYAMHLEAIPANATTVATARPTANADDSTDDEPRPRRRRRSRDTNHEAH